MINALNLPMYVVGGGVCNSWDAFAPAMMEQIKLRSFVYVATLGEDPNCASGSAHSSPQSAARQRRRPHRRGAAARSFLVASK